MYVSSKPEGHGCRLHAWAERGQTVVIESSSNSRLGAIETAADSLRRTILERTLRGPVAAVLRARAAGESARRFSSTAATDMSSALLERRARERPGLLLALGDLDVSSACVQWARVLADALDADLDACRVLSNLPQASGTPTGGAWLAATRRQLTAARETRRWCAEVLPGATLAERLVLDLRT